GVTAHGLPFLAMEWLEGEDLAKRLARSPLDLTETMLLLQRATRGAAVAHASGVVHRDIKPSNLFFPAGGVGELKLIYLGVARRVDAQRGLTKTGAILGTAGYMSPEQAMGDHHVDARSDVFALGCVLYECLTGRPAFTGVNAMAVIAKVLRDEPPPIRALRPE